MLHYRIGISCLVLLQLQCKNNKYSNSERHQILDSLSKILTLHNYGQNEVFYLFIKLYKIMPVGEVHTERLHEGGLGKMRTKGKEVSVYADIHNLASSADFENW